MEFHVVGLGGALCVISLGEEATLLDLQAAIEEQTGIPAKSQRLVVGSRELTGWDGLGTAALAQEVSGRVDVCLVRRSPEQLEWLQAIEDLSPTVVLEWLLHEAPAALEDREVILAAVGKNSNVLRHAASEVRTDPKFVLTAVAHSRLHVDHVALELLADREFVLTLIRNRPRTHPTWSVGKLMGRVAPALRFDRDVALAVVAIDAATLSFFSPEVRADRDVVLTTVAQNGSVLGRVHPKFRADRQVVLAAVAERGQALEHASGSLRGDREVVLTAVKQNGVALQFAAFHVQADTEIVLAAVAQDEAAMSYAAPELAKDRQFVLAAYGPPPTPPPCRLRGQC